MTPSPRPNDRIRVLMVMPSYYPVVGGMEIQVERQIPYLREFGIDVSVLTRKTVGALSRENRDGAKIRRIVIPGGPGMRSVSFTALGTLDILRHRRSVDVIHAHSIMSPTTIAATTGTVLRKPVVVTLHARYEPERLLSKPLGNQRLRLYRRIIDRFVSINGDIDQLLSEHNVPRSKIASIPNGIDTTTFRPATVDEKARLRSSLELPNDDVIAVFVGRLQPVKQVDVLLRALAGTPRGMLVIVGDGPERQALEILTRNLGLDKRVSFTGMVTNVVDYLRASDIFVLPSSSEGLSVALLEAMSTGLVPIATAIGGNVELVQHDVDGLLVPPGNVEALRDALSSSIVAPAWRDNASKSARWRATSSFDLRVVAERLTEMYRGIAGDAKR